jgi:single-stranded DNA-binding protein
MPITTKNTAAITGYVAAEPYLTRSRQGHHKTIVRITNDDEGHRVILDFTAFNTVARMCVERLRVGDLISVLCHFQTDEWIDDETGEPKHSSRMVAHYVRFEDQPVGGNDD